MKERRTERRPKPTSLSEIAETYPPREFIANFRQDCENFLQEHGSVPKGTWYYHVLKVRSFSKEIEIGDGEVIPLDIWRRENKHPEKEPILIDIGMRTQNNEPVALRLDSDNTCSWAYLERSLVGRGFGKESPTKKDVTLHAEALKIVAERLSQTLHHNA